MIDFLIGMLDSADEPLLCVILEGFGRVLAEEEAPQLREALGQPEVEARMVELAALSTRTRNIIAALAGGIFLAPWNRNYSIA